MLQAIGIALTIVSIVIVAVVVKGVIDNQAFTGINNTVSTYIPTLMLLGGLAYAGATAYGAFAK